MSASRLARLHEAPRNRLHYSGLAVCLFLLPPGASAQVDCSPSAYAAQVGPYNGFFVAFDGGVWILQDTELQLPAIWTEATIEVWQRMRLVGPQSTFHISFENADFLDNRVQAHIPWIDGRVYWDFGDLDGTGRLSYLPTVDHETWQHYAFVASQTGNADRSSPFMRIYRNGVLEAEKLSADAVDTRPFGYNAAWVRLGGFYWSNLLNGDIAEFRIWTVARTQTEIQRDWQSTPSGDGLLLHWKFAEGSGTTVEDLSGNGYLGRSFASNGTGNAPLIWRSSWGDTGWFGTLDPCRVPQVSVPPEQPVVQELCPGEPLEIHVDAAPDADVVSVYQWQRNGVDLPGQTEKTLRIPPASADEMGLYSIRATNHVNPANETVTDVIAVSLSDNPGCQNFARLISAGIASEILRSETALNPRPRLIAVGAALSELAARNPSASLAQMNGFAASFDAALRTSSPHDPDLKIPANFLSAARFAVLDEIAGLDMEVGAGGLAALGFDTGQSNRDLHLSTFFQATHVNYGTNARIGRLLADAFLGYATDGTPHPLLEESLVAYVRSQGIEPYPTGAALAADYPEILEALGKLPSFDEFLMDQAAGFPAVQGIVANELAVTNGRIAARIDDILAAISDHPTILDQVDAGNDEATVLAALAADRRHLRELGVSRSAVSLATLLARNGPPETTAVVVRLQDLSGIALQVNESLSTASTALQGAGGLLQGAVDLLVGEPKDKIKALGQIASSVGQLLPLFFDNQPSVDEQVFGQIIEMRRQLQDVQVQLNDRFDRVDRSLNTIYATMIDGFDLLNEQTQQINGNVQQVQIGLATVASNLNRLEQNLYGVLTAGFEQELIIDMDAALGVFERTGVQLPFTGAGSFDEFSSTFFTWARTLSANNAYAGPNDLTLSFDETAIAQLGNAPLGFNINNLRLFPLTLGESVLSAVRQSNPTTWSLTADAYAQLARENPWYFARTYAGDNGGRLNEVIGTGENLKTAMNNARDSSLFAALTANYNTRLQALQQEIDLELEDFLRFPPVGSPVPQLNLWGGIWTQPAFDFPGETRMVWWLPPYVTPLLSSPGDWWKLLLPQHQLAIYMGLQSVSDWSWRIFQSSPWTPFDAGFDVISDYQVGQGSSGRRTVVHPSVPGGPLTAPDVWISNPANRFIVETQFLLVPPSFEVPLDFGPFNGIIHSQVNERLRELQVAFYTRVLQLLESSTAIQGAADQLTIIESFLDAYVSLALPESINYSNVIRSAFRGSELGLGREAVRQIYQDALNAANGSLQLEKPNVVAILGEHMNTLQAEFDVALDPSRPDEIHPYVRWTLANLEHLDATVDRLAVDDIYSTPPNAAVVVSTENGLLANDVPTPAPAIPLPAVRVTILTQPQNGLLVANSDGLGGFAYTPNSGFVGTDSFTYRAQANLAASGSPNLVNSDPATVLIRVEIGDHDHDGDVDGYDSSRFVTCVGGVDESSPPDECQPASFVISDFDGDADVDLADGALLQRWFTGE